MENGPNRQFESLLEESIRVHGHLCAGQVLGVRMSMLGMREIGINDPKGADRKNLIVYVEMDRCATDAVQSVTGCSLGRRTLKFMDYGKMAATFVNVRTGLAVRIIAREDSREGAWKKLAGIRDERQAQQAAYKIMSDEELFTVMKPITVELRPEDLPGRPLSRVQCSMCGEYVQDMREVYRDDETLCRACADGGYYLSESFFAHSAMQNSHNGLQVRSKVWLETKGEPVFGRGRRFLLDAIDVHGSISGAAKEVGISYRKAWSYIKAMESRLGIKLVERQAGGNNGGGAELTKNAKEFLEKFKEMEDGLRAVVDRKFQQIFSARE